MSSFTTDLVVKVLNNGDKYEVIEEFEYYRDNNTDVKIIVPKGFVTDFATVPRIFWSIFPPFGIYTKASVLHDYLIIAFKTKKTWDHVLTIDSKVSIEDRSKLVKRCEADAIFKEAMKCIGVPAITRWFLYTSVRFWSIIRYGPNA